MAVRAVALILVLVGAACHSGSESTEAAPELLPASIAQAIGAELDRGGVPAGDRQPAVYRYPRVIEPGEAILDAYGETLATAPSRVAVWWADLEPTAMWSHPGLLVLEDPESGDVVATHSTMLWPDTVGGDAPWGLFEADAHPDAVVAPPVHGEAAPAAEAPFDRRQGHLEEGGEGCEPVTHMLLLFGQYDTAFEENAWTANEAALRGLSKAFGIAPANVSVAKPAKRGEPLTPDDIKRAMSQLSSKCCDQILLHYTGHGWISKNPLAALGLIDTETGLWLGKGHIASGEDLANLMMGVAACKWIVILDACFSEGTAKDMLEAVYGASLGRRPQVSTVWTAGERGTTPFGVFADKPKGAAGGTTVTGTVYTQVELGLGLKDFEAASWAHLRTTLEAHTGKTKGYNYNLAAPLVAETGTQNYEGSGPCCACETNTDCAQPEETCRCAYCEEGECVTRTAEGKPCNDKTWCTEPDTCDAEAACHGKAVACTLAAVPGGVKADPQCAEATCDEAASAAAKAPRCAAKPKCASPCACDDGDKCTDEDACAGLVCTGTPRACDDGDPCTVDGCDPATGACVHAAIAGCCPAAGQPCDDGDGCTVDDVCTAAGETLSCKGKPKDCDDGNVCTDDGCLEGACTHQPLNGAPCDDGDPCTGQDACVAGACAGVPLSGCCTGSDACDDGEACTADQCVEATCQHAPLAGASCDDGDDCTVDDACASGEAGATCQGTPKACDDGEVCTIDACAGGGCTHLPLDGAPCDDSDPCTGQDACVAGACAGVPLSACCTGPDACDDGEACTADQCVEATCQHAPLAGTSCDDGDDCTVDDACASGEAGATCQGTPKACDDGEVCTVDACAGGGCTHLPLDGVPCDDGDACTSDACLDGACQGAPDVGPCACGPAAVSVPPGGGVLPKQGGAPYPIPAWLDYVAADVLVGGGEAPCELASVTWHLPGPLPAAPSVQLADLALILFEPGKPCDPGTPHPPLAGATTMLRVSWSEGTGWVGSLWQWQASGWQAVQASVPFETKKNTVHIEQIAPGLTGCAPYKLLAQAAIEDGGPKLVWKMTAAGPSGVVTDPNAPPIACEAP